MPNVEKPDKSESGDKIRFEHSAHDGDCFNLVYEDGVPVHRTGPIGVEDV